MLRFFGGLGSGYFPFHLFQYYFVCWYVCLFVPFSTGGLLLICSVVWVCFGFVCLLVCLCVVVVFVGVLLFLLLLFLLFCFVCLRVCFFWGVPFVSDVLVVPVVSVVIFYF